MCKCIPCLVYLKKIFYCVVIRHRYFCLIRVVIRVTCKHQVYLLVKLFTWLTSYLLTEQI